MAWRGDKREDSKRTKKSIIKGGIKMKQRAPALPDSATFQQLWDALGSKLIESTQEHLLYTQGVRVSSPLPPTTETEGGHLDLLIVKQIAGDQIAA